MKQSLNIYKMPPHPNPLPKEREKGLFTPHPNLATSWSLRKERKLIRFLTCGENMDM